MYLHNFLVLKNKIMKFRKAVHNYSELDNPHPEGERMHVMLFIFFYCSEKDTMTKATFKGERLLGLMVPKT